MVFLAECMPADWQPLVLMGSEIPFPFETRPSTILVPGIPEGVIATMPALDERGVLHVWPHVAAFQAASMVS